MERNFSITIHLNGSTNLNNEEISEEFKNNFKCSLSTKEIKLNENIIIKQIVSIDKD